MDINSQQIGKLSHNDHQQNSLWRNSNNNGEEKQGSSSNEEYYVRSYTCNFCKKGFSNAQALGGHMNIHRRDRAKLRQSSSCEDLQSMSGMTTIEISSHKSMVSSDDHVSFSVQSKLSTSGKMAWFDQSKDDFGETDRQALPLFIEGPYLPRNTTKRSPNRDHDQHGLDLELRLGPEPHQGSASKN